MLEAMCLDGGGHFAIHYIARSPNLRLEFADATQSAPERPHVSHLSPGNDADDVDGPSAPLLFVVEMKGTEGRRGGCK